MAIATFTPLSPASLSTAESDVGTAVVTIGLYAQFLGKCKELTGRVPVGWDALYPVSDHLQTQLRQPGFDRRDRRQAKVESPDSCRSAG